VTILVTDLAGTEIELEIEATCLAAPFPMPTAPRVRHARRAPAFELFLTFRYPQICVISGRVH